MILICQDNLSSASMKDIFTFVANLQAEMNRLQCQAEELSPLVSESIEKCGISKGMSVADVGCGTGQVSFLMSSRVGPSGRVIGIDANTTAIELCRKTASTNKIKNVSFIVGSAYDLSRDLPNNSIDVAYSRFLLTHLEDPVAAMREMMRITTRKGLIMIEDCDLTHWIAEPDDRWINQLWKWYSSIIMKKGGDPTLGRKLYRMFIDQGLNPKVDVYSMPVTRTNRNIWISIIDVLKEIDKIRNTEDPLDIEDSYNSQGTREFIEPREEMQRPFKLHDLVNGLWSFSQGESSLFVFPIIFRVWARKI
jgi:ubiquinone/menaquinone biosynthesis C-methylase UbiE